MALEACKECGKEISTEARACPHCGVPMRKKPDDETTTTQATSKEWKAHKALGYSIMMAGVVIGMITFNSPGIGWTVISLLTLVVGGVLAAIGELGSWWHHD